MNGADAGARDTSIDRREQYKDASPATVLDQLNENWMQLRMFKRAVADRDRIINQLHGSIAARDKAISRLNDRLRYAKVRLVLLYSLIGGIAAKGAEELVLVLLKLFLHAHGAK